LLLKKKKEVKRRYLAGVEEKKHLGKISTKRGGGGIRGKKMSNSGQG